MNDDQNDGADGTPQLEASETPADYEVGYGKPPLHSRFRKGDGRPRPGRPTGRPNLATVMRRRLHSFVRIKEDGRTKKVTRLEAIVARELAAAMQGHGKGFERLVVLMRAAGMLTEELAPEKAAPMSEAEKIMVAEFLAAREAKKS